MLNAVGSYNLQPIKEMLQLAGNAITKSYRTYTNYKQHKQNFLWPKQAGKKFKRIKKQKELKPCRFLNLQNI